MKRRRFLGALGIGTLAVAGGGSWLYRKNFGPDVFNPCEVGELPSTFRKHPVYLQAFADVDPQRIWDSHVHLMGLGHGQSGNWASPKLQSWAHPIQKLQFNFYMNAVCADSVHETKDPDAAEVNIDHGIVKSVDLQMQDFPTGPKAMLMAFDWNHDQNGNVQKALSPFYTPNSYAQKVASQSERLEWIASVHPYRQDALEQLRWAAQRGARAIKWLPPAMGMDPSSPLCDDFYAELKCLGMPLICHAGEEKAVHGENAERLSNPLLLRRPLEHGVKVIVAHCASLGESVDLDKGPDGPKMANIELFARMMDNPAYEKLLLGEISALPMINRSPDVLKYLIGRTEWHHRLVNASDYPLPAIMPLYSVSRLKAAGLLASDVVADFLLQVRKHNGLLFDYLLKRHLQWQGNRFAPAVFETRRHFMAEGP